MNTSLLSISNAAAGATNDIRDIKPPIAIPDVWWWVLLAVAVLVLIAAAFLTWYFLNKRAAKPAIVPIIPPHVRARQILEDAFALLSQPRPFCILVSDTIRLYLEERFSFRAPERTTEEFLRELKATELLLPDQKQSLGEFLSVCDMVKFAKYEPGEPELRALHESALRLVAETEPQPVTPSDESSPVETGSAASSS